MIDEGGNTVFRKLSTINRRMFIFSLAKAVVFTGIVGRLFSLQISENKKYLTLSDKNRLRESRLPPVRGKFLDYFGNTIAGNLEVYQLHVVPEQVVLRQPLYGPALLPAGRYPRVSRSNRRLDGAGTLGQRLQRGLLGHTGRSCGRESY